MGVIEFQNLPPDLIASCLCLFLDNKSYFALVVSLFPNKNLTNKIITKTKQRWEDLRNSLWAAILSEGNFICCPNMPRKFGGHRKMKHYCRCDVLDRALKSYFEKHEEVDHVGPLKSYFEKHEEVDHVGDQWWCVRTKWIIVWNNFID